jgi:hypothetical protein
VDSVDWDRPPTAKRECEMTILPQGYRSFTDSAHPCPTCGSYTASEGETGTDTPAPPAESKPGDTDEQRAQTLWGNIIGDDEACIGHPDGAEFVDEFVIKHIAAEFVSIRSESSAALQADKDHLLALVAVLREEQEEVAVAERRIVEFGVLAKAIIDWDEYHGGIYSKNNPNVRNFVERSRAALAGAKENDDARKG